MTQEDKELLLRDLCARLPYGVKCNAFLKEIDGSLKSIFGTFKGYNGWATVGNNLVDIETVRPYLRSMSSMTEEQKNEISKRYNLHTYYGLCIEITNHSEGYWDDDNSCNLQDYLWLVDWFNKNHFDYRGLIEKGLAIDATGLNIYC